MKICRREHVGRALERLMSATNTKAPTGGNGENRDLPSGPCFLLLNLYGGDFNQFIDAMRIGAPEGQRDNSPGQMSGASAALGYEFPKRSKALQRRNPRRACALRMAAIPHSCCLAVGPIPKGCQNIAGG